ncbi:MAG: M1 family aminopeptidase [Vicinamibacterales bacterium]
MADPPVEPGVPLGLARHRSAQLSRIRYELFLAVPGDLNAPVQGNIVVQFWSVDADDVVFDFAPGDTRLGGVLVNGVSTVPSFENEHITVAAGAVVAGENEIRFEFTASELALNRQPDGMYSLFVPARARTVFPCFDQPDLKAHFTLSLEIPSHWAAVSNTAVAIDTLLESTRRIRFQETELLPTYLFAFAAGTLASAPVHRDGRVFYVWHRQQDASLLERNLDEIVGLHAHAIAWLETYTGIPYPFSQCGLVLIPSFQFSGMEHPGAIYYNASRLLLEPSASEHDHLTRAALIAHETAHIWFGDLVTMRWFDDVWMKEVFANLMAEKILAARLPPQRQALRFFLSTYPAAYVVDRSEGANPIRQALLNLADAAHLYGPIIYLKAPIVFRQLEMRLGEEAFRDGVRRYLGRHRFGNADWNDLLAALDTGADLTLGEWSAAWIDRAGRPIVTSRLTSDAQSGRCSVSLEASEPGGAGRVWRQRLEVAIGDAEHLDCVVIPAFEDGAHFERPTLPLFVLAGGGGLGYGAFPLDQQSCAWLLASLERIPDALTRAVAWVALWEELLAGMLPPSRWFAMAIRVLAQEVESQTVERMLADVAKAFWLFLTVAEREASAPVLEACLSLRLSSAVSVTERASWFAAFRQLATTSDSCRWLEGIWRREESVPGLVLQESDETALAFELALRREDSAEDILETQRRRITNDEHRARFEMIAPTVLPDSGARERAFAQFADGRRRTREPWVLTALGYLSHPLRQAHARRFIRPGLVQMPEIRRTGDIFFPSRWAETLLSGHSSPAAAAIVRECLAESGDWPPGLRNAVLVAADLLFRAAGVTRPPQA